MTQAIHWAAATSYANLFATTDLNSLAIGAQKTSTATAPQISNNTVSVSGPSTYVQFGVTLASLTPVAGGNLLIVLVPKNPDGSTWSTGTDGATVATQVQYLNMTYWCCQLQGGTATALQYTSPPILLPPGLFKAVLINRSGVALASSGNQIAYGLNSLAVG